MDGNIIEMKLNKGRTARTSGLYQYDYGQKLQFSGAELPVSYEVHFSNAPTGESKTMIGDSTGVEIPDEFLLTGLPVYVWVYLHDSEDDGETEYAGVIDVISRAQPTNDEPTPVQQDTITQAIAALQSAVVSTGQDAADASAAKTAAEAAQTAAQAAQTAAETAQGKAETAQAAAEAAAATAAADAAEAAVADVQVDVAEMVTAAQAAQTAAEAAQGYAEGYATAASESAGDASESATAASGSASSAGDSAAAAAASALKAEGFAVGKQNSIDVESGSPYYENNAKYYAGVAEDAATALTDFIDDTAGDGDTDKVWSADKTVRLAPIEDPEFTGSITLGSRQNTKGDRSFASGYQVSATGDDSHAEGSGSYAAGDQSHAEGVGGFYQEGSSTYIRSMANGVADHTEGYQTSTATRTNAIGGNHAEGYRTKAHYGAAHAEGECTKAGERGTHAEGYQTIANCEYQHVQGKLNVVDNAQRYADIVGNGTESNGTITRSNASALEWNGTLHLKGDVYVGCNDDSTGGSKLAKVSDPEFTGSVSLGRLHNQFTQIGQNSAVFGHSNTASGVNSLAEGESTVALSKNQHVQGYKNYPDDQGVYADIVGNGYVSPDQSYAENRNISALDWSGNLHLRGDVYTGANWDSTGGNKLATQGDVANLIDDTAGSGDTDVVWSADKSSELLSAMNATENFEEMVIPYRIAGSGYINAINGGTATSSNFDYTDYVDIENYAQIFYKRSKSTSDNAASGIALYNEHKQFIAGFYTKTKETAVGYMDELQQISLSEFPAKYARFSVYHNTETYGDFLVKGKTKQNAQIEKNTSDITECKTFAGITGEETVQTAYRRGNSAVDTHPSSGAKYVDIGGGYGIMCIFNPELNTNYRISAGNNNRLRVYGILDYVDAEELSERASSIQYYVNIIIESEVMTEVRFNSGDYKTIFVYLNNSASTGADCTVYKIADRPSDGLVERTVQNIPSTSTDYYGLWDKFVTDGFATRTELCVVDGKSLYLYHFQKNNYYAYDENDIFTITDTPPIYKKRTVLLDACMHGNEKGSALFLYEYINRLCYDDSYVNILSGLDLYVIPLMNPTGYDAGTRTNYQDLDINRDAYTLATAEATALVNVLNARHYDIYFDIHQLGAAGASGTSPEICSTISIPYESEESIADDVFTRYIRATSQTSIYFSKKRGVNYFQSCYPWKSNNNPTFRNYAKTKSDIVACAEFTKYCYRYSGTDSENNSVCLDYGNNILNAMLNEFLGN